MIKVLLFSNNSMLSIKLKEEFIDKIKDKPITIVSDHEVPDYIISIGGDGTLLSAFHNYQHLLEYSQFIGVHTGHLGFYADWLSNGIDDLILGLIQSSRESVSYPLIAIEIEYMNKEPKHLLALNEFVLKSKEGTALFDVYIEDFHFETFRGDGVCISSPTGSTGLNKSLGGAVMHPKVEAMQMTEMASINNLVYRTLSSPIIVSKEEWIVLKPVNEDHVYLVNVDNQNFEEQQIKLIKAQIAKQRIRFSSLKHTHFWDRVESSFIGRDQICQRRNDL